MRRGGGIQQAEDAVFGVAHLLGVFIIVPRNRDDRAGPWRGRGGTFALMASARSSPSEARLAWARHHRRIVRLRRRRHHRGHLGYLRRPRALLAGLRASRHPDLAHHPGGPVRRQSAHHAYAKYFRPHHHRVVHGAGYRRHPHFRPSRALYLAQPWYGVFPAPSALSA